MGTANSMLMGGLFHTFLSARVEDSSTSAVSCTSAWPGKRLIFHTRHDPSALYLALPLLRLMLQRAVWVGTGMRITTLVAARPSPKPRDETFTATSTRERPTSRMRGSTWGRGWGG